MVNIYNHLFLKMLQISLRQPFWLTAIFMIFAPKGLAAFTISTLLAATCSGYHSGILLPSSYGKCGQLLYLGLLYAPSSLKELES
jgi:hypothetical protein